MYVYVYIYRNIYIYIYIECEPFQAQTGKIRQPWVRKPGEEFQEDTRAIFRHFLAKFKNKEPRFSETTSARCIWVWLLVVCLLPYMLPYEFRRRVEMHGGFTRGSWLHGLAWLGFRGSGGLRGTDIYRGPYAFRWHLDMRGDPVGELGSMAWLGSASAGVGVGGRGRLGPSPPCGLPDVCKRQYVLCASVHVVVVCLLQYTLPKGA